MVDIRRFTTSSPLAGSATLFPLVVVAPSIAVDEPAIEPGWLIVLALRRCVGLAGHGI